MRSIDDATVSATDRKGFRKQDRSRMSKVQWREAALSMYQRSEDGSVVGVVALRRCMLS